AANATRAAPTTSRGSTRAPDPLRGGFRPARLAPAPSDRILSSRWMADTAGPSEAAGRLTVYPPFGGYLALTIRHSAEPGTETNAGVVRTGGLPSTSPRHWCRRPS